MEGTWRQEVSEGDKETGGYWRGYGNRGLVAGTWRQGVSGGDMETGARGLV